MVQFVSKGLKDDISEPICGLLHSSSIFLSLLSSSEV